MNDGYLYVPTSLSYHDVKSNNTVLKSVDISCSVVLLVVLQLRISLFA